MQVASVQWGGPFSFHDSLTKTIVQVRVVGLFDGTIAHPDGANLLRPLVLKAVADAAEASGRTALSLEQHKDAIAQAAQAHIAPQLQQLGAAGRLSIGHVSFDEADRERLMAASAQLAKAQLAARKEAAAAMPAPQPARPASGPSCPKCGSLQAGKFCQECGTSLTGAGGGPVVLPPGDFLAAVVRGPIAFGTSVSVPAGYVFYGMASGIVAGVLAGGVHTTIQPFDLGLYVREAGLGMGRVSAPGPKVLDAATGPRTVTRVVLDATLRVADAQAVVRMIGNSPSLQNDHETLDLAETDLLHAVDDVLATRIGAGQWSVAALASGALAAEVSKFIAAAYLATDDNLAGTSIDIMNVELSFSPPANAPVAPPPVPLAPGAHVLVRWSDGNRYPGISAPRCRPVGTSLRVILG